MKEIRLIRAAFIGSILAFVAGFSSAALVDQGSTTLDTNTGLVWLDLTATQGRSAADVSGQFGPNGEFEGYRYAKASDLELLFSHAGFGLGVTYDDLPRYASMSFLQSLVGVTAVPDQKFPIADSFGMLSPETGTLYSNAFLETWVNPGYNAGALIVANAVSPNLGHSWIGSWLVRPVPEPSVVMLFLVGLAGILLANRRAKF